MTAAMDSPYSRLAKGLQDSPLNVSPAEAHGLLCGLLCVGVQDAEVRWAREVFGTGAQSDPVADDEELGLEDLPPALRHLARETRAQFMGDDLALSLVLPEEEAPLRERAEGLYDWTRGLLLGLGLAGLKAEALSGPGREMPDGLVAHPGPGPGGLARAQAGAGAGEGGIEDEHDEEEESALMELREFLWVAVRLLHEETGRVGS